MRTVAVAASVDDAGIRVASRDEIVLDVLFDGRRIFSFWVHRDGSPEGDDRYLMAWPKGITEFLHGTTRLVLREHGAEVPILDEDVSLGDGTGRIAVVDHEGRPLALDKSLRRVLTFDTRSPEQVAPLMNAIGQVLDALEAAGTPSFLAYGTLLGAVREGRLLGHDSDADLGYVSRYDHPVDVMRESFRLQAALVAQGYRVSRYSGAAFKVDVEETDGSIRGLDVFGGFLRDGHLHLMGEIRTPFRPEWVWPLGTTTLEGREFAAPADTDRFLTATYGPSWRVPDPAFHFPTPESTHRRFNGWFRGIRENRAVWDRYYSQPRSHQVRPSRLVRALVEEWGEEPPAGFVDLGCGGGSDAAWVARRGVPSVGLDISRRAYRQLADRAAAEGWPVEFLPLNLYELRSALGSAALLAARPGPRVVVARHLVDTLAPRGRRNLWRVADMLTRGGGTLHLEFLAQRGGDGFARTRRVQPVRPPKIAAELTALGATVVERKVLAVTWTDPGFTSEPVSGQGEQQPATGPVVPSKICRMVVRWER